MSVRFWPICPFGTKRSEPLRVYRRLQFLEDGVGFFYPGEARLAGTLRKLK